MTSTSSLALDPYDRAARLYPALIAIFPALLAGAILIPHCFGQNVMSAILMLIGACGLLVLAAQVAREAGKRKEIGWFASQGGKPSVAMLRHRDQRLLKQDKSRYRTILSAHGLVLPEAGEEDADPQAADEAYGAASSWLLAKTQNRQRFNLLFRRNIEYGFRRNLVGLRKIAIIIDILIFLSAFIIIIILNYEFIPNFYFPKSIVMAGIASVAIVHAGIIIVILKPTWVHSSSEAFGRQLLASCDALDPPK